MNSKQEPIEPSPAPTGSALTEAANRALSRFENNKHVATFDGSFWKTCAWAMADDLKRALSPNNAAGAPEQKL